MVGTRKTPLEKSLTAPTASMYVELLEEEVDPDNDEIIDQLSVRRTSIPPSSSASTTSLYVSSSVDITTPSSSFAPTPSYTSPYKRLGTPSTLDLDSNLEPLVSQLDWRSIGGSGLKWLSYDDPVDTESTGKGGPLGIILVGQLGPFVKLRKAENNFDRDKPEFSLQLEVGDHSLLMLRDLIRRRDKNFTVINPLRIKVSEVDIMPHCVPSEPFLFAYDGTSTDDDYDGDHLDASRFMSGDKVAVQVWFGSYMFTDRSGKTASGPTFRLLAFLQRQALTIAQSQNVGGYSSALIHPFL
ncbi:hypothetical protein F5884DRAFT_813166 [Xylogone sp. PMI_703]|nr:hypothetical protein F5884DRAFT_813166 [Xylogone sp. PMI_703]